MKRAAAALCAASRGSSAFAEASGAPEFVPVPPDLAAQVRFAQERRRALDEHHQVAWRATDAAIEAGENRLIREEASP